MAISFGNTSEGGNNFSHNNNGNFLVFSTSSTTNNVTAVTYNGVSMTQIGTAMTNTTASRYISQWGLVAPASGSNNISITGGTNHDSQAISLIGVDQTTPYTNLTTNNGTSTTPSITLTTTATGSYVFGLEFHSGSVGTAGANTTQRNTASANDYQAYWSSTNTVNSASGTLNVTISSTEWNFKAFSLNPTSDIYSIGSTLEVTGTSVNYTIPTDTTTLFVGLIGSIGSDTITGATVNSNSMTLVGKVLNAGTNGRYTYLFRYYNPPTGSQTIAISGSGLADGEIIFYGNSDTVTTTGTDTAADGTTAKAISVTTTVNNSWVVSYASASNGNALSAGSNTAFKSTGTGDGIFDSNANVTPAGSRTLNINAASSGTGMGIIKCELTKIVTASTNSNMFLAF